VPPDYLRFDGERLGARTFPAEHYITLLEHVRSRYGETCWHALAGDVASYAKATKPLAPAGRPVRLSKFLIVSPWTYDPPPYRYRPVAHFGTGPLRDYLCTA